MTHIPYFTGLCDLIFLRFLFFSLSVRPATNSLLQKLPASIAFWFCPGFYRASFAVLELFFFLLLRPCWLLLEANRGHDGGGARGRGRGSYGRAGRPGGPGPSGGSSGRRPSPSPNALPQRRATTPRAGPFGNALCSAYAA